MRCLVLLAMALAGCQVHDEVVRGHGQALLKCPNGSVTEGVDVSSLNGTIDWSMVAGANIGFAYLRATEGSSFIDPAFATNWSNAGTAGVLRGPYHFFHASQDPVAQADFFVQHGGGSAPGDLPPALDLETTDGQSASTVVQNAMAFLDRVQATTGRTPIVYLSSAFFTSLGSPPELGAWPLWVAQWGVTCPNIPDPPWTDWAFWQTSDTGAVAGIPTGNADHDQFNGSLAELQAFIAATNSPDGGTSDGGESPDLTAPPLDLTASLPDLTAPPLDLTAPLPDDGVLFDARFDDILGPVPDLSVPRDLSVDAAAR
jgi:lysozyme